MSCNKGQSSVTQDEVHDHVPSLIGNIFLQFAESMETNPSQKRLVMS